MGPRGPCACLFHSQHPAHPLQCLHKPDCQPSRLARACVALSRLSTPCCDSRASPVFSNPTQGDTPPTPATLAPASLVGMRQGKGEVSWEFALFKLCHAVELHSRSSTARILPACFAAPCLARPPWIEIRSNSANTCWAKNRSYARSSSTIAANGCATGGSLITYRRAFLQPLVGASPNNSHATSRFHVTKSRLPSDNVPG